MRAILTVLCTCPDSDTAQQLASRLVEERLAACVNILPNITSVYHWDGEVRQDQEQLLLIKTDQDCFTQLSESLANWHPYDVPEIIALPVSQGHQPYLDWVSQNTWHALSKSNKHNGGK